MATTTSYPAVSEALIDALDKTFPERTADPAWSDREIWMRAGERRAVRFLRGQFNEQQKGI